MKRKLLATILIVILFCNNIYVIASNQTDAEAIIHKELPNLPARPVPSDTSEPIVEPPETVIIPQISQSLVTYNEIFGNVFEDYKQYTENSATTQSQVFDNNGVKDINELGVKNVIVQLLNESNEVVSTTYTDENGNYSFSFGNEISRVGKYKIRYIYGMLDNNQYLTDELKNRFELTGRKNYTSQEIVNVMKYNGQDYISKFTSVTPTYSSYEEKIIKMRKGYAQIFLLFDCSYSMTSEFDENGKSKLQVLQESAIDLVEGLLGDENTTNISIGIIGFGQQAVIRKQLSNNKQDVIDAIKNINNLVGGQSYGSATDIATAVLKAEEAFINKDSDMSNRTIVLLSDGAPILYKGQWIYDDDNLVEKLNEFAINTNNDIKSIINRGAKFVSLIPKGENSFENSLVEKVLQDAGTSYIPENIKDVAQIILNDIKLVIEENKQAATEKWDSTMFNGDENADRREQVKQNYSTINYDKIEKFNLTINNIDSEKVKKLVSDSYMYTEETSYREINPVVDEDEDNYILADGTKYSKDLYNGYRILKHNSKLILIEKSPSALEVSTKITGIRITLSDGSIFEPCTRIAENVITDTALAQGEIVKPEDINCISNVGDYLVQAVDIELIHGATVELEYIITVRNNSEYDFEEFTLIDYAPAGMIMNPEAKLLTEDRHNKDYGWSNVSRYELVNNNEVSQEKTNLMTNYIYPITKFSENNMPNALRTGFLGPNGERYIKIVFQAVVNAGADNLNYENETEVLNYSNTESRRMADKVEKIENLIHIEKCSYTTPGNGFEFDFSQNSKVIIVPPFGKAYFYIWTTVIIFIIFSFLIVLKINLKKSKKGKF